MYNRCTCLYHHRPRYRQYTQHSSDSGHQSLRGGGFESHRCHHINVLIQYHDHRARVYCCRVTDDWNMNCAVYTVGNVADDGKHIHLLYIYYYTLYS